MKTIYSVYKNEPIPKGLVEIINTYDNRYHEIAIDGEIIDSTYKQGFEQTVLKRSFIKECVKKSGVSEDELQFVIINWENLADTIVPDYDANDFGNYQDFIDFLDQNPSIQWTDKYGSFVKELALGVKQLEKRI